MEKRNIEIINEEKRIQELNYKKGLFSEYLKLDKNQKGTELSSKTVYKVIYSKILPFITKLTVKDMKTGEIIPECNSVWFNPINTYFAVCYSKIKIGKSARLFVTDDITSCHLEEVDTSAVVALDVIMLLGKSDILAVLTENSLYITQDFNEKKSRF